MRVCMIAYTFYEFDLRVRRYAEELARRGAWVDVIALSQSGQTEADLVDGVHLFRIQERTINENSRISYLVRLLLFFVRSAFFVTKKHFENKYDLIHVHSVPDFEVFAAWFPKMMGAKIILDIHDLVPEFYASKFSGGKSSIMFKLLAAVEKLSASFADHVIIANDIWRDRLCQRSVAPWKCTTLLNFPDTAIFSPATRCRQDGKFVMLYPGTLNHHQGLDIAIRAFSQIKEEAPHAEFQIYGLGPSKNSIAALIIELDLQNRVFLHDCVVPAEIARIMRESDLGIVPKRNGSFSTEAFSTKILEFMAAGVPVIVSETKVDRYYFDNSLVKFFRAEDDNDLAAAMLSLIRNPEQRLQLANNGLRYVGESNWNAKKSIYFDIISSLLSGTTATEAVSSNCPGPS
jgi:glycosyltransferase involved in cell wall biosynthesis